jgi:beta-lactamase family protein
VRYRLRSVARLENRARRRQDAPVRRFRYALFAAATAAILGGGGLIVLGMNGDSGSGGAQPRAQTLGDVTSPSASPAGPSPAELARADRAKHVKQLDTALKQLAGDSPDFSVAVLDARTGQSYTYRGTVKFDTASIAKAQILACMLLKAQDAGREPTSGEMDLAKPMIRISDNNAATALFKRVGGRSAVGRCNKRLGLTQTVVNSSWGLTRTTAADQIKLLTALVNPEGLLNTGSRRTAFTLMNTVTEEQQWGVPSIAEPGETAIVKNGWDTRSADGGLWAVNTIGRVTADGVDVSLAVLSHNNRSFEDGRDLVEKVAALTRRYLKY